MPELTDRQLTERAADSLTMAVTVVTNCYTNRAGMFWVGTIFYCKETGSYYEAEAGKPFSAELRNMLLENVTEETPDD